MMAIKTVLPQIEERVNRYLTFAIGDDHAKFEIEEPTKGGNQTLKLNELLEKVMMKD